MAEKKQIVIKKLNFIRKSILLPDECEDEKSGYFYDKVIDKTVEFEDMGFDPLCDEIQEDINEINDVLKRDLKRLCRLKGSQEFIERIGNLDPDETRDYAFEKKLINQLSAFNDNQMSLMTFMSVLIHIVEEIRIMKEKRGKIGKDDLNQMAYLMLVCFRAKRKANEILMGLHVNAAKETYCIRPSKRNPRLYKDEELMMEMRNFYVAQISKHRNKSRATRETINQFHASIVLATWKFENLVMFADPTKPSKKMSKKQAQDFDRLRKKLSS